MATEVILPVLGETMDEGTIVKWLVDVGQPVQRGQPLYQLETDKAVLEVEAPANGVLRQVFYGAGSKVPVLTIVGLIGAPDEDISAYQIPESAQAVKPTQVAKAKPAAEVPVEVPAHGRVFATPRARKLAAQRNVDLSHVKGTGPGGRIVEQDIWAYLEAQPVATPVARRVAAGAGLGLAGVQGAGPGGGITKADVEAVLSKAVEAGEEKPAVMPSVAESMPMTGVRRIIAERMSASAQTTAHVTLTTEVDATDFVQLRTLLKNQLEPLLGFAVSYTDILVAIVARALREYRYMNVRLVGEEVQSLSQINVGVAVDTERGLLVPVIRDADQKGIAEIARTLRELATRAREGKSMPDDLSGGTFTITNLGMFDIDAFTPIINLPECAILGVGRLHQKPTVYEGQVCVRQMMVLSLTFDHRLVDGAPAARFLQRIKQLVEQPYLMLA